MSQLFGGNDTAAAATDIASSSFNIGADAIPVVGNIAGAALSVLDSGYNIYKTVRYPSWNNLADTGLTLLGILPGFGSIRDSKVVLRAGKQLAQNTLKAGNAAAMEKTLTRRALGHPKTKLNTLDANGNIIESVRVPYFDKVSVPKAAAYTGGTIGNLGYSIQDGVTGLDYLSEYFNEN